jgi:hypothetical protein
MLDRFPIFASIGVPEVWRYDGTRVAIFKLAGGMYQEQGTSEAFPGVTGQIITQFIEESTTLRCGRVRSRGFSIRVLCR